MLNLEGYLDALASEAPAPGGGSAAMVVAAAGCALVAMVARICASSNKFAEVRARTVDLAERSDLLRARMMQLREADEHAFDAVVAARGKPEEMQRALATAAETPLQGAQAALEALLYAGEALELHNSNLISDVGCAAEFAYAALASCAFNVRINHKFMKDAELVRMQSRKLEKIEVEGKNRLEAIRAAVSAALS